MTIAEIVAAAKLDAIAIEQDGAQLVVTVAPVTVTPETAIKRIRAASGAGCVVYSHSVLEGVERFTFTPREVANV